MSSSSYQENGKILIRASSVSTYMHCPYKWYKMVVEGVRVIPNLQMVTGTAVHKGAEVGYTEKIEKGTTPPLDVLTDAAVEEFHDRLKEDIKLDGEDPGKYEKIVVEDVKLYRPTIETTAPKAVEKFFKVPLNSPYIEAVQGTADIVFQNGIGDIKVTNKKATAANYKFQLSVYALLAQKCGENFEFAEIHNVVNAKAVHVLPLKLAKEQTRYIINNLISKIHLFFEKGIEGEVLFTGNPSSFLCDKRYCDLYAVCPFVKGA